MDNRTLTELLRSVPPAKLTIIGLMDELSQPDGSIDLNAAATRQDEVRAAATQARSYTLGVERLLRNLIWKMKAPQD